MLEVDNGAFGGGADFSQRGVQLDVTGVEIVTGREFV
jgi:hypothetical protein